MLQDAAENYPAWITAIEAASEWIHFETYIFHEGPVGRRFADLLAEKARSGVKVRLIYDWIGTLGYASRRFWRKMSEAGVDVRRYNTPFLNDLSKSTEIVLETTSRRPVAKNGRGGAPRKTHAGSAPRTAAGIIRLGHVVGAAIRNRRELGPAEAVILFWGSMLLILIAAIAAYRPRVIAVPTAVVCVWTSLSLLLRAYRLRGRIKKTIHRRRDEAA